MADDGYGLTAASIARIRETNRRVLGGVDPMADGIGTVAVHGASQAGPVEQWAQVTSLTPGNVTIGGSSTINLYPGQLYQRLGTSGSGAGTALLGTCWLNAPNGETVATGTSYRAFGCAVADDGKLVLDAVVPGSGGSTAFSGANVTGGSSTSLANNTEGQLIFSTAVYDTDSYISGDTFVAPQTGYYLLIANVLYILSFPGAATNYHTNTYAKVNGTISGVLVDTDDPAVTTTGTSGSGVYNTDRKVIGEVPLTAGDVVTWFAKQITGAGQFAHIVTASISYRGS